jgi:hypothetical protein
MLISPHPTWLENRANSKFGQIPNLCAGDRCARGIFQAISQLLPSYSERKVLHFRTPCISILEIESVADKAFGVLGRRPI